MGAPYIYDISRLRVNVSLPTFELFVILQDHKIRGRRANDTSEIKLNAITRKPQHQHVPISGGKHIKTVYLVKSSGLDTSMA